MELANEKVIVSTLNSICDNIATINNGYLHTLQTCVIAELRVREKRTLRLISEYRVNNEKMFTEKMEALKERDTIKEQNAELAEAVAEAC